MVPGVLDFHRPLREGGLVLYRRYQRPAQWALVPHALDIAKRADGRPDFHLAMVRSRDAGLAGYGVVDFRVIPVLDLDRARGAVPGDHVDSAGFGGGWLRLLLREPGRADTSTILPPVRIASNGLGAVRLAAQLSPDGVTLLKRALLEGTVLIDAWAEMELSGVSPRLPHTVQLTGSSLVRPLGEGVRTVSRGAVVSALAAPGVMTLSPPLAPGADLLQVADAVADRLRNLAATPVPSPDRDFTEWWNLEVPSNTTRMEWDLRDAVPATRIAALRFDPIGLVQAAVAGAGLEALITMRELPEFETGFVPILVTANIPDVRTGVLSCGVDISAEPHPPDRVQAIAETIEFMPPEDRAERVLRFAPGEPADYDAATFVVASTSTGIAEWRSPRVRHRGGDVRLTVADFPVHWVPVTASPQLLAEGIVAVSAHWEGQSQTVTLTRDRTRDALVHPPGAANVRFACTLTHGTRALHAIVPAADHLALGLPLFAEYGAHSVEVEVDFAGGPDLIACEFKAEDDPDTSATTLSFTRARATRTWSWFARSPFAPGYRYRAFIAGAAPMPWSDPQSPFATLRINARNAAGLGAGEHV